MNGEIFYVLISGFLKYFKIKGCDIVVKVMKLLNVLFFYFLFVVKFFEDVVEII